MNKVKHTYWYKDAVIYQIYPRSFCDSNNDGIGDIKGIISKLDYLKDLGVNCVWLSPIYKSPQVDNGYDISDYRDIDPTYGSLEDFKLMLQEMHKRGIRLIMDLVVNHTSDQHPWFKEAIKDKNSPYRDYYIFKKGRCNGKKPPNNWTSFFEGSAWEKDENSDEYYLHLFCKEQPDLNWENQKVREEVVDILKYWLDMGVDGFRCDVITLISKQQEFKSGKRKAHIIGSEHYVHGPRLDEYLKYLYENALSYYDCMTVGESVNCTLEDTKKLINVDNHELDMIFNFSHMSVDRRYGIKFCPKKFKLVEFKRRLSILQDNLYGVGWNTLFIENHDQRRSVGRFNTDGSDVASKSLATAYFFLWGTPFIYQGQEIGMTNVTFKSNSEYRDVEYFNMLKKCENPHYNSLFGKHLKDNCRDNARTPMQWDDSLYAGFSNTLPWIGVNPNKDKINVINSIANKDSIYHFYKDIIQLRKKYDVVINGKYEALLKDDENIFAYKRITKSEELLVVASFSNKEITNPFIDVINDYQILIGNYDNIGDTLKPYQCFVGYKKRS